MKVNLSVASALSLSPHSPSTWLGLGTPLMTSCFAYVRMCALPRNRLGRLCAAAMKGHLWVAAAPSLSLYSRSLQIPRQPIGLTQHTPALLPLTWNTRAAAWQVFCRRGNFVPGSVVADQLPGNPHFLDMLRLFYLTTVCLTVHCALRYTFPVAALSVCAASAGRSDDMKL